MVEQVWHWGDLGHVIHRPLSIFVLTAGERLWKEVGGTVLQPSVELAWRWAEREATDEEVTRNREERGRIFDQAIAEDKMELASLVNVLSLFYTSPGSAARTLVFQYPIRGNPDRPPVHFLSPSELVNSCDLMRELFGGPGGAHCADPAWLTPTVLGIARGIYEEQAFGRIPILADALEEAGCNDKNILTHCRSKLSHIRGCWVVDMLTGRR